MGKDKGLAGKTWSEPSQCLPCYTTWHFESSEYKNTRHTGAIYTNAVRKFNRLPSKGIKN